MDTGRKIDVFGALAVILFGAVAGGAITYQHMDDRISGLEQDVGEMEDRQNIVYINGINDEKALVSLFQQVDQSTVSIDAVGNSVSQGSGFVYSERGHIITNEHVIAGADRIDVTFTDGTTSRAQVVGKDMYTDLAVLKVNKNNLDPLELGDSSQVREGQAAVAIGNPFGLSGTMTSGIISAKNRNLRIEGGFSIPNVVQTDAAINPGNSGGPLMNIKGEVVGVNTAIQSRSGTFNGVGFAVPSNTVERVASEILDDGDYEHSWIGVSGIDVNSELAEEMDLDSNNGFLVVDVVEDSPADNAGLRSGNETIEIGSQEYRIGGDVIVSIDDAEVTGIDDVLNYLAQETEPGDTVNLEVIRDGERVEVPVTLSSRPE